MDSREFTDFMVNNIKPWAKVVSGGREINCRCFYCKDSKDRNKGHFYIKIPTNDSDISVGYCQKCKTSVVITPKILMSWDIYDAGFASTINKHNAKAFKNPSNLRFRSNVYNIVNDTFTDDDLSLFKLQYINSRLGTSLSYTDCLNLKIVLNIGDIIRRNKLTLTRDKRVVEALDNNFVGFLSHDNAFVNLRNLDIDKNLIDSINKRYINYNLVNQFDNTCRFYTIPSIIDFADPTPIQLHVAEGAFDILSVYLNLRKNNHNCIYTNIGGSGYFGILKFFIQKLMVPNIEIHLYPDNDMDKYTLLNMINKFSIFKYSIYIHRNTYPGEKDFGVPLNRINEVIERIS